MTAAYVTNEAVDGHWLHESLFKRISQMLPLLRLWTSREFQVRYRQSSLGLAWSIAQPVAILVIYGAVVHGVLRVDTGSIPYVSFAFVGLVVWSFTSTALGTGVTSLLQASTLVSKVYFPREVIPLAVVCASSIDYLIATGLLLGIVLFQGIGITWTAIAIPLAFLVLWMWVAALAVVGATVTVFFRDIRHVTPMLLQLVLIGTPILYPASLLPAGARWLSVANPFAVVVEAIRSCLLQHEWPQWGLLGMQAGIATIALYAALRYLISVEPRIVDVA